MPRILKVLLPILVLVFAVLFARHLLRNQPTAERRAPPPPTPVVEVQKLSPQSYQLVEHSRGSVQARTRGNLVAEVTGAVVAVSENYRSGAFFNKDDELLRIDPRDYAAAVTIAESELAQARLNVADQQAKADQAQRDWQRLGLSGKPSDLTLRKPQLAGAQAALAAAKARLSQAKTNLARTRIRAPYDGRLLTQLVDIGEFVSSGKSLGEIYATDALEVRLPLSARQLNQIHVPRHYRDGVSEARASQVMLSVAEAGQSWQWPARLVRTEAAVDEATRQSYVIAQVDDPYKRDARGRPPLKVGQFVQAEISGRTLENVYVVPRAAVHEPNTVWIVDAENRLQQRDLSLAWRGTDVVVASAGLSPGVQVVTSALALPTPGSLVAIAGAELARARERKSVSNAPANNVTPREAPTREPKAAVKDGAVTNAVTNAELNQ